jgi:hypothetical protein
MSEIDMNDTLVLEIEELEEVIAYSVETGGSVTCTGDGCSGEVHAKTLW